MAVKSVREGWREVKLGECHTFETRREQPTTLAHDTIYLGLEHLATDTKHPISNSTVVSVTSSVVPFGATSVLFGRLRPYLRKVAKPSFQGVCTPEILVMNANYKVCQPEFLFLLASSKPVLQKAIELSSGTRMPRTSAKDINDLNIPLPPLEEQHRIVDLMESVDDAIDSAHHLTETTKTARSALLQDLLSPTRAAEEGWREVKLGEVVEVSRSRWEPKNHGQQTVTYYNIPFLDEFCTPCVTCANEIKSAKFQIKRDAVLVSLLNPRKPRFYLATASGTSYAQLNWLYFIRLKVKYLYALFTICLLDKFFGTN
jgi:type I restriction enzyme S subunit